MTKAKVLYLPLKAEYFDAIVAGTKGLEYRLATPYWRKRLEGRTYSAIEITRGYPKKGDTLRRDRRAWRGFARRRITHEHFGDDPVEVFAIDVSVRCGEDYNCMGCFDTGTLKVVGSNPTRVERCGCGGAT